MLVPMGGCWVVVKANVASNTVDAVAISCFVLGGLLERFWHPKAIPVANEKPLRFAQGIHFAKTIDLDDAEFVHSPSVTESWKEYLLSRIDYVGCGLLILDVLITLFINFCRKHQHSMRMLGLECLACIFFLLYSSYEKQEAKEQFQSTCESY